jgi:ubiquitin carboxyl-terminal hydrolase L3
MADGVFNWPPLESNPEVFSEYLLKIGMNESWGISEVYGFDEELL